MYFRPVTLHDGDCTQPDFSGICSQAGIHKRGEIPEEGTQRGRDSHANLPFPGPPGLQSLHSSFPAAHLSRSLLLSSRSCLQLSQHSCASPESRSMQCVICQAAFGKHSSLPATEHPQHSSLSPPVTLHPAATLRNSTQTSGRGNHKRNAS